MPTYQYACTECGHQHEAVQSFSDPALTECPNCQGKLRKVFNSVGIVFKGSGFYRNDSRAASATAEKAAPAADSSSSAPEKSSSGSDKPKSDAKPAPAKSSDSSSSSSSSSSSKAPAASS